jgi:hypothetical protein
VTPRRRRPRLRPTTPHQPRSRPRPRQRPPRARRPPSTPTVTLDRCRQTGWSYAGCTAAFPDQGLQWVRWACLHDDTPYARSVLCTRLAEYLYLGIGGPADPALASAMFDWQCQTNQAAYRHNCYAAAEILMFADPTRAREFIRRGCDSADQSPSGCKVVLPQLEAGIVPRELVVTKYRGLRDIAVGSTCKLWLWGRPPDTCNARLACGDVVLYGLTGSQMPCNTDGTGGENMTQLADGDPALVFTATTLTAHDDDTGRLGAFALDATFK